MKQEPEADKNMTKIALIPHPGLGDAIVVQVLAHNLSLNGYQVHTHHQLTSTLDRYFASSTALPPLEPHQYDAYDSVIHVSASKQHLHLELCHGAEIPSFLRHIAIARQSATSICYALPHHSPNQSMAENIFASLKHTLKLKTTEKSHGLVDLDFEYRKSSMRVAIHPTSSDIAKNWSPHKYLQLAEKLEHIGMQPHFVLSPTEQKFWKEVCDCRFPTPDLSIPELAKFLYESGYFIGSDSGPGHLASMLGVPTLTIFPRKRSNYQWRPGFAKNVIAAPASRLSLGKARYHRRSLLSADRVMQYFMHLAEEEYSINTAPIPAIKLLGTKKPDLSVS